MPRKTHKDPALIKDEFYARLGQGYGITEACKVLRISRSTYYNWRDSDPVFAAECKRLLSDPVQQVRRMEGKKIADAPVHSTWQDKFIAVYRKTGDRDQAQVSCGESAVYIEQTLSPTSDKYDEEFHKRFMEEEQKRLWRIEDSMLRKAEHDMPTARFALSNLLKEKYGKVGGEVTVNNQHWFTSAGAARADKLMDDLFGNKNQLVGQSAPRPETDN
jgi:hypothetical protein